MKTTLRSVALGALLAAALAVPAAAQDGFALKAGYIYNRSVVEGATDVPTSNGFTVGAEYVLPLGLGIGVSGYTSGKVRDFDAERSDVNVLAEANYFLKLPLLPIAPYVGVHGGLGRYSKSDDAAPGPRLEDSWRQFGFQAGLRLQLISALGIDAQYRRVSTSLEAQQGESLSRQQVIVGVTLF